MTKDNIDNDMVFNVDYGAPIMSYDGLVDYLMFK